MGDLPVEIGYLHDVAVDDADGADPSASDVLSGGTSETTGTNDEHTRVDQP